MISGKLASVCLLLLAGGCQMARRIADNLAGDDFYYWLALTVCGLALYRVLGIVDRLRSLRESWPVVVLFPLATAWRAFGPKRLEGVEWRELVLLGALWFGVAVIALVVRIAVTAGALARRSPRRNARQAEPSRPVARTTQSSPIAESPRPPMDAAVPSAGQQESTGGRIARPGVVESPTPALADAVTLLRDQKIGAGREILTRLCKENPNDLDCLVLAALEHIRPPENRKKSWDYLKRAEAVQAGSGDVASLWVLATYANRDYKALWERYHGIAALPVRSGLGYFLSLWCDLCASDLLCQCMFRPTGSEIDGMLANSALVGAAQLMLRQHDRARQTFANGRRQAAQFPDRFEETFHVSLPEQDRESLASLMGIYCTIGQALALYDLGQIDGCQAIIRELVEQDRAAEGLRTRLVGFLSETERWL